MQVKIHLVGALHQCIPDAREFMTVEVQPGDTIRKALDKVKVPPELVKSALLDRERVPIDTEVHEGQEITIMALIGGG